MKGKTNIIITMTIAGGLAGIGGALAILAPSAIAGSSMTYEPINVIAANGFNGIAVALLGNSHPIGIVFSSVFISHIQRGGTLASLVGYVWFLSSPWTITAFIAVLFYNGKRGKGLKYFFYAFYPAHLLLLYGLRVLLIGN